MRARLTAYFGEAIPPVYEQYRADPEAALARYCDAFLVYWDRVFASLWPRIEPALEREALLLGHALATEGLDGVLTRVHPRIDVTDGRLRVSETIRALDSALGKRRLSLIPLFAGDNAILTELDRDDAIVIGYGTPHLGELWDDLTAHPPDAALAALLGDSRARVLAALDTARTTTDLATALHLTAGTVSHHLTALSRAGLVSGVRLRNRVYYRLTTRGQQLRGVYTQPSADTRSDTHTT